MKEQLKLQTSSYSSNLGIDYVRILQQGKISTLQTSYPSVKEQQEKAMAE
jgi:hypothetical protein